MHEYVNGLAESVVTKCMARNTHVMVLINASKMPTACECRFNVILHYRVLCSYYVFIKVGEIARS